MTNPTAEPSAPQLKTQTILRAAGVAVAVMGVWFSNFLVPMFSMTLWAYRRHDWAMISIFLAMFIFLLSIVVLLIYSGGRCAWRPETANPRLMLLAGFPMLYVCLRFFADNLFPTDDLRGVLRARVEIPKSLYDFGILLFCSMAYYASCTWLRRHLALTARQQEMLARRPSGLAFILLALQLLGVWGSIVSYYLLKRDYDYMFNIVFPGLFGTLIFAIIAYRAAFNCLAIPDPSPPADGDPQDPIAQSITPPETPHAAQ